MCEQRIFKVNLFRALRYIYMCTWTKCAYTMLLRVTYLNRTSISMWFIYILESFLINSINYKSKINFISTSVSMWFLMREDLNSEMGPLD